MISIRCITHKDICAGLIHLDDLESAGCYLLHYTQPFHHARHYIGWAKCIGARITAHAQGKGAHLTKAVYAAGISFELAAIWPGASRSDERRMHRRHDTPRWCPICRQEVPA